MAQRVRWKVGENEIEVEGTDAFVEKQLSRFLRMTETSLPLKGRHDLPSQIVAATSASAAPRKAPAPAEYFREKKPRGGTERLLVLARYLQDFRSKDKFTRVDVSHLCVEAKIADVHGEYFRLAIKQGLLRTVGKAIYSLTISGEDAVNAMPVAKKGS